ncbi:MAG TPA: adenosylcobinamide-GDP ribazoletransferase [Noviherbaspirillum sp.]
MRTAGGRGVIGIAVHQVRLFFIALQFFTRLPVPRWVGFEPQWLHHASRYFPAAGIVVGGIGALVCWLAGLAWPPAIAVLLSTCATIYATGAFHEDGFADVCDGFGGGMTPERVLEIMKDSRIGAYGAIGIAMLLALKCTALSLLGPTATAALFIAHPLSRFFSGSLIRFLDYAKAEGKAKPLAQHMSNGELLIAAITVAIPFVAMKASDALHWKDIAVSGFAMACATVWMARLFRKRIGGYTGDCLGAVQQVTEVVFYLALLATVK